MIALILGGLAMIATGAIAVAAWCAYRARLVSQQLLREMDEHAAQFTAHPEALRFPDHPRRKA